MLRIYFWINELNGRWRLGQDILLDYLHSNLCLWMCDDPHGDVHGDLLLLLWHTHMLQHQGWCQNLWSIRCHWSYRFVKQITWFFYIFIRIANKICHIDLTWINQIHIYCISLSQKSSLNTKYNVLKWVMFWTLSTDWY